MLTIRKSISKKTQKPYHAICLEIKGITIPISFDKQAICRILSIVEGRYIDITELDKFDCVEILRKENK